MIKINMNIFGSFPLYPDTGLECDFFWPKTSLGPNVLIDQPEPVFTAVTTLTCVFSPLVCHASAVSF